MTPPKLVAIHQPNFFPWLGFFNKYARADIFILLDDAQFPKTGGTWTNRVRILFGKSAGWLTVPIVRAFHGTRLIRDIRINNSTNWRGKLLQTIRSNYGRAPYFREVFPQIENLINTSTDYLMELNMTSLLALTVSLGYDTKKFMLASTLKVSSHATRRLIELTQAVGGTGYLCGMGAGGYQEDTQFTQTGLELVYQNFPHPLYPQGQATEFIPGLSIIDALMNCGLDKTRTLLNP